MAQPNAATPPGTRPRCGHGCPPVPGQPLAMCRPPMTSTSRLTTTSAALARAGLARNPRRASCQPTGAAASTARIRKNSSVPVISTVATAAARVLGGAHCQPTSSWDHTAVPAVRNTASAPPSAARLARAWSAPASRWPPSPAWLSRASSPLAATSAVRRQQRGRSARSAASSSVNSAPYRSRQPAG